MKTKQYRAVVTALPGKLLIGGIKRWQSSWVDDEQTAQDTMAGYVDGQEHNCDSMGCFIEKRNPSNLQTLPA